jgi:hypothetical protein
MPFLQGPRRALTQIKKAPAIVVWRVSLYGVRVTWTWLWTRIFMWTVGHEVWRFCEITPQLIVGGQMRAGGWRWLVGRGITAVVNLREEHDDRALGVPVDRYLWLPTTDDYAPTQEHLRTGVAFVDRVIRQGGKVYIHCASGVGRAPTLAAAYLITTGTTPQRALAIIQRVRPFIKPTPPQVAALERFAAGWRHV